MVFSYCSLAVLSQAQSVDTTPPTLTALSLGAASVDTTAGPVALMVGFSATDNSSGVTSVQVSFVSPSGNQLRVANSTFAPALTVNGTATVTFPQFGETGVWKINQVSIADAAGNIQLVSRAGLSNAGFPTEVTLIGRPDLVPPTLTAFSFSPTTANAKSAPAAVTFTLSATDDLSGVVSAQVFVTSPSGKPIQASASFSPGLNVNGTAVVTFPSSSESGTWMVNQVMLQDAAGNVQLVSTAGLVKSGFSTDIVVIGSADTTPPNLTAFKLSPTSINTSGGPATVTATFSATDDLSGIALVQVFFTSPSGTQFQTASASFGGPTSLDGTAKATFPKFSETGKWKVTQVMVQDVAGNVQAVSLSGLTQANFPTDLTVQGAQDTTPPELTSVTFAPAAINVATSSQVITVNFSATDDLSGVTSAQISFVSPSTTQTRKVTVPVTPGTSVNGTASITFPQLSETGIWKLDQIILQDVAGNMQFVSTSGLFRLNLPTDLFVMDDTAPVMTIQPTAQAVCAGRKVSFTAAATGKPAPTVQWQEAPPVGAFLDIPGATASTYTFSTGAFQNGNRYRAVFTNSGGNVVSDAASLTASLAFDLTANPANVSAPLGQAVVFSAATNANDFPTVQWQVSMDGGATFQDIPGATSIPLSFVLNDGFLVPETRNGNEYRAVLTNACSSATTSAATLLVAPDPPLAWWFFYN